ncbi:septum formation inhibitor Maf [Thioalkalivibrio denitrificans]|uniref:7-methyl-GTP pyrophosphatase n=1 Tax=Thioalkalivibrio denitrificans TaxID=108003 RepID=A0A1V3NUA4_9GAMM|nr:Maf family nucleotide pyrophosphatase [Thioalkalivibrio denitrificans]OOG28670.1 septum formation inhibitor Maf [Thioalkalivibrio denitrificans]
MTTLVLASSSRYRRELLARLGLEFQCHSPDVDERVLDGESPDELVTRLAHAKAEAVVPHYPDALIIGSDQCAELDGRILGKPGDHDAAVHQLRAASARTVAFHTGLCLLNARNGRARVLNVPFRVHFRTLDSSMIEDYLRRETPYDCAGSFRSEGLGIALFERLEGDDPTALIGLPLIALVSMLREEGVAVLGDTR